MEREVLACAVLQRWDIAEVICDWPVGEVAGNLKRCEFEGLYIVRDLDIYIFFSIGIS